MIRFEWQNKSVRCSKVVIFIHGFPEIWYSWRHQMVALAQVGYHSIALDLSGYGLSSTSKSNSNSNPSFYQFVDDILSILEFFNFDKVVLVGKDFGSWVAYLFCLTHPTRVAGVISLGVPFLLPNPQRYKNFSEGFYLSRWKEPGRAEADFARFDVKTILSKIYILFSRPEIPIASKDKEIMDLVDLTNTPLPPWLTQDDLEIYTTLYQNSGFDSPMQIPYKERHEFKISNPRIEVPGMLIMGGKDYFLKFPGIEEHVKSEKLKDYHVGGLEIKFLEDGTHFMQEQFPNKVNQFLITFLKDHVQI
ncbi:hypothetical protein CsatB_000092 [Cannabis sativa]